MSDADVEPSATHPLTSVPTAPYRMIGEAIPPTLPLAVVKTVFSAASDEQEAAADSTVNKEGGGD